MPNKKASYYGRNIAPADKLMQQQADERLYHMYQNSNKVPSKNTQKRINRHLLRRKLK